VVVEDLILEVLPQVVAELVLVAPQQDQMLQPILERVAAAVRGSTLAALPPVVQGLPEL
jgi:hypothetical protein